MTETNILTELQDYVLIYQDPSQEGSSGDSSQKVVGSSLQLMPGLTTQIKNDNSLEMKWTENNSKILLDFYLKFKPKLGTFEIKNNKMLWAKISEEFKNIQIIVTPNHCLNRWRVLERNYKKFVDNQQKTGRGRKFFPYQEEMEKIFEGKRNIVPEVVLSSDTVDHEVKLQEGVENENEGTDKPKLTKSKVYLKRKTTTLEKIRADIKAYFDERLSIEKEKLSEIRRRNNLIMERNKIINEKACCCLGKD